MKSRKRETKPAWMPDSRSSMTKTAAIVPDFTLSAFINSPSLICGKTILGRLSGIVIAALAMLPGGQIGQMREDDFLRAGDRFAGEIILLALPAINIFSNSRSRGVRRAIFCSISARRSSSRRVLKSSSVE